MNSLQTYLKTHLGEDFKTQELKGDSGERKYSRFFSSQGSFIFVQNSPQIPRLKLAFASFLKIQKLLSENNFLVPKIFLIDSEKRQCLLQDIGDHNLEHYYFKNKDLSYHKKAISEMLRFQKTFKENEIIKNPMTKEKFLGEMIKTYNQFKISYLNRDKLFKEFEVISSELANPKKLVPSHRDFHSRNLMIHSKKLYMIDFQDAGLFPLYYDLVSLVRDFYIPFSKKEEEDLVGDYLKKSKTKIIRRQFLLTTIQRGLQAIGCFQSFYNLRKQTTHLKYIDPALEKLALDLKEIGNFPHYQNYVDELMERGDL